MNKKTKLKLFCRFCGKSIAPYELGTTIVSQMDDTFVCHTDCYDMELYRKING